MTILVIHSLTPSNPRCRAPWHRAGRLSCGVRQLTLQANGLAKYWVKQILISLLSTKSLVYMEHEHAFMQWKIVEVWNMRKPAYRGICYTHMYIYIYISYVYLICVYICDIHICIYTYIYMKYIYIYIICACCNCFANHWITGCCYLVSTYLAECFKISVKKHHNLHATSN